MNPTVMNAIAIILLAINLILHNLQCECIVH